MKWQLQEPVPMPASGVVSDREARVAELGLEVEAGLYRVDARQVAAAILDQARGGELVPGTLRRRVT